MHDGIGIAETRAERLAEVDVADLAVGHRIHQAEVIDIDRHAARRLADAEPIEAMEGVGPELDAGADLAQLLAFSSTSERMPFCANASAVASPPMPPPAIRTGLRLRPAPSDRLPEMLERVFRAQRHARGFVVEIDQLRHQGQQGLRSAGFNGCSIRACARSTDGMISCSSAAPALVRSSSLTRLSPVEALRSI